MRLKLIFLTSLLAGLPACAEFAHYGAIAVEQRRTMNDLQARTTMAATCDISIGAYFRELNETERRYAALVCGGVVLNMAQEAVPAISKEPGKPRGTLKPGYSLAPLDWPYGKAI